MPTDCQQCYCSQWNRINLFSGFVITGKNAVLVKLYSTCAGLLISVSRCYSSWNRRFWRYCLCSCGIELTSGILQYTWDNFIFILVAHLDFSCIMVFNNNNNNSLTNIEPIQTYQFELQRTILELRLSSPEKSRTVQRALSIWASFTIMTNPENFSIRVLLWFTCLSSENTHKHNYCEHKESLANGKLVLPIWIQEPPAMDSKIGLIPAVIIINLLDSRHS